MFILSSVILCTRLYFWLFPLYLCASQMAAALCALIVPSLLSAQYSFITSIHLLLADPCLYAHQFSATCGCRVSVQFLSHGRNISAAAVFVFPPRLLLHLVWSWCPRSFCDTPAILLRQGFSKTRNLLCNSDVSVPVLAL